MVKRLSAAWLPVAVLLAFLVFRAAQRDEPSAVRRTAGARASGPAVPQAPAPKPPATESPSAPAATASAAIPPAPQEHPTVTPPPPPVPTAPAAAEGGRTPERSDLGGTERSTTGATEGTDPSARGGTPSPSGYDTNQPQEPYSDRGEYSRYGETTKGERSRTEPPPTKPADPRVNLGKLFDWATAPPSATGSSSDTKAPSTQAEATRELAYTFHVFDGFEAGNVWAVESAADHAELALTDEHVSEGQKALKATFQAFGKGNFELRREVSLDLSKATTLVVDVYNDAGPMDLALAVRAGYYTTLFNAPRKPLQTGWNKDIAFPLGSLTSSEGGWGSSWSWSRDSVTRLSLIFHERDEKRGSVTVDNLRFDRPADELGQKGKPVLKKITASATAIERYEPLELAVEFQADYQNFFDRTQVDLRATFFAPSGKRSEVRGFVCATDDATAKPTWKIRFTPNEVGLWRYEVALKDAGGEATSHTYEFLCRRQAAHRGFIRVSKTDPQYFEFDDGSLYYPVGQNVCWASNYDYFAQKIQAYGGNYLRVWLCPWNLQLEDPKEPGKYDLRTAKALDDLLDLCQRRGLAVQLVLRYHGMQRDSWDKNPYNTANGGPCKYAGDFFTDARAKDLHKSFLDYVVARWGHSPAIFAWELWNEVDLARADRETDIVDWHRDMAAYLKRIDANRHLVTTSVSAPGRCAGLFELPDLDFVPVHIYGPDVFTRVYESYLAYRPLRKPIFIGEFSAGTRPSDDLEDARGIHLHAGLWLAFTTPLAGNAMPWWWDTFIDKNKLYTHWAALTRYAQGFDPRGKSFEVVRSKIQVAEGVSASLQGILAPSEAYLWVYDEDRILRPDRAERPLLPTPRPVALAGMLAGTFQVEVWDPHEGKVLSQKTVSTADGTLRFALPACSRDVAVKVTKEGEARPRLEW